MCTELRLYTTLRYLGGGSVHDIRRVLKTKKTSTYVIINQVCKAIIQCPALEVKFPQTQIECDTFLSMFRLCSCGTKPQRSENHHFVMTSSWEPQCHHDIIMRTPRITGKPKFSWSGGP